MPGSTMRGICALQRSFIAWLARAADAFVRGPYSALHDVTVQPPAFKSGMVGSCTCFRLSVLGSSRLRLRGASQLKDTEVIRGSGHGAGVGFPAGRDKGGRLQCDGAVCFSRPAQGDTCGSHLMLHGRSWRRHERRTRASKSP
jgi:hypothetical protein